MILTKNKHTSKISKWNFLPFIALFSCYKCNREVHFKLMRPRMSSLCFYEVVLPEKLS